MLKNGYVATFEFVKSIFTSVRRLLNRAKLSALYLLVARFFVIECYAVRDFWDFPQPKGRRELFELLLFCDRNSTYESRGKLLDGWWNLCDCFVSHDKYNNAQRLPSSFCFVEEVAAKLFLTHKNISRLKLECISLSSVTVKLTHFFIF